MYYTEERESIRRCFYLYYHVDNIVWHACSLVLQPYEYAWLCRLLRCRKPMIIAENFVFYATQRGNQKYAHEPPFASRKRIFSPLELPTPVWTHLHTANQRLHTRTRSALPKSACKVCVHDNNNNTNLLKSTPNLIKLNQKWKFFLPNWWWARQPLSSARSTLLYPLLLNA